MKKRYQNLLLGIAVLFSVHVSAQLSGVVTINSGVVTGGTNYQTFTALKNALVSVGVNGPLTVNVVSGTGPYNEQVDFPAITGVNGANTITVNGNGCKIVYNSSNSGAPWTLGLSGADYMTFNNLIMEGQGQTYAMTCHLWNGSDNNAFNNCTMIAPESSGASSYVVPLSISGAATGPTSTGNCGNNNVFTSCLMTGGYYGVTIYASTSAPFNTGNNIIRCTVRDFYTYGIINSYNRNFIFRGNTIERPNQGQSGTCAGIYLNTQSYTALVEGNLIHKLWDGSPNNASTTYGIYLTASATGSASTTQNNIVSVNKSNGTVYGIYLPTGNYHNVIHNTISIGDAYTGGSGTIRGIYSTGGTSTSVRNNIVSVTHPGTGTKHCLYYTQAAIVSNYNVLYMNSGGSANHIGYYTANQTTMLNWQAANSSAWDQNSWNTDPIFAAPPFSNFTPGSNVFNNLATNLSIAADFYNNARSLTPDPGAIEFFNTACGGNPVGGSVVGPTTALCPNSIVALGVGNSYTASGLSVQWQISNNSALGPFTVVTTGATNQYVITPPVTGPIWYSAIVSCASGGSVTLASLQLSVIPTVTNSVPYHEGFETIAGTNKLPNCNWSASNIPAECQTNLASQNYNRQPRTGSNYAAFYYYPAGPKYFYSNGIQLYAGITYSGSVWAIAGTDNSYSYYDDWGAISLHIGPNQSPTGLNQIATSSSPFTSGTYAQISNTFQVATSGIYYASVKAVGGNGYGYNPYISWDDLEITIPCSYNPVTLAVNASSTTICFGETTDLTAVSPAANDFSWNTGETTAAITVTPSSTMNYVVTGTSTLTGCFAQSAPQLIIVNPKPLVSAIASAPAVCAGGVVNLQAVGNADVYSWSNGPTGIASSATLTANTTFTLVGTNQFGCKAQATIDVNVNPNPTITATYPSMICKGEKAQLTAHGANSYVWVSNSSYLPTSPIIVSPQESTTYTLTGTDAKGCSGITTVVLEVDECAGLKENVAAGGLKLYPNPTSSEFTIELNKGSIQTVEVADVTGRIVLQASVGQSKAALNVSTLSNGVYYVKVLTNENNVEVIKVVKQ